MNITFEAPDKVNGLMTITLEKDDYQGEVDKTLKDYRKRIPSRSGPYGHD